MNERRKREIKKKKKSSFNKFSCAVIHFPPVNTGRSNFTHVLKGLLLGERYLLKVTDRCAGQPVGGLLSLTRARTS